MDSKHRRTLNIMLLLTYLICFIRLVTLKHQIGLVGVGIFGIAFLLYYVFLLFIRRAISETMIKMITARMKTNQYRNASKVLIYGVFVCTGIGLVFTVFHLIFADFIGNQIYHSSVLVEVLRFMAPSYLFGAVAEALSAYIVGAGETTDDALLRLFRELLISLLCFVFAGLFTTHGIKVGNLLRSGDYASVFGARGCALAVSLGSLASLVINAFFYVQKKVNLRRLIRMDKTTVDEEMSIILQKLLFSGKHRYISYLCLLIPVYVGLPLVLQSASMLREDMNPLDGYAYVGALLAYAVSFFFVLGGHVVDLFSRYSDEWLRLIKNEQIGEFRESFEKGFRGYLMKILPVIVLLFAIHKPLVAFAGCTLIDDTSVAALLAILSVGFLGVYLYIRQLFSAYNKFIYLLIGPVVFLITSILMMELLRQANPLFMFTMALFIGAILSAVVFLVLFLLTGHVQLHVVDLLKPVLSSIVAGGLCFLIATLMFGQAPDLLAIILCVFTFVIVYMILMTAIHGFRKRELSRIPLGVLLRRLFYSR